MRKYRKEGLNKMMNGEEANADGVERDTTPPTSQYTSCTTFAFAPTSQQTKTILLNETTV